MYIAFNNASGSEASPAIAYHKVSLLIADIMAVIRTFLRDVLDWNKPPE